MYSCLSQLSFHYAALGVGRAQAPQAYPFAPAGHAFEAAPARRMAQRLQEMPPQTRKSLLDVIRLKASDLPWTAIHPSWLEELLEPWRPQWRQWALASMPPPVRAALQTSLLGSEEPAERSGPPPRWWGKWFPAEVKRQLGYPDLPPWEKLSGAAGLPGTLWEREDKQLARMLAVHGTRGFVSCVRQLPRSEAQQALWQLPEQCHAVANEAARAQRWSEDPFWASIFQELSAEFPDLGSRLIRTALADWMRAGVQQEQLPHLRRLAYRLPRSWGAWVLRTLDSRPSWLVLPVQPSLEAWKLELQQLAECGAAEGAPAGSPPGAESGS